MADRAYTEITYPAWADILLYAKGCEESGEYGKLIDAWKYYGDSRRVAYDEYNNDLTEDNPRTTTSEEEESRWGVHSLAEPLEDLRIPYDMTWGQCGDHSAGEKRVRYDPVTGHRKEYVSGKDAAEELLYHVARLMFAEEEEEDGSEPAAQELVYDSLRDGLISQGWLIKSLDEEGYEMPDRFASTIQGILNRSRRLQAEADAADKAAIEKATASGRAELEKAARRIRDLGGTPEDFLTAAEQAASVFSARGGK